MILKFKINGNYNFVDNITDLRIEGNTGEITNSEQIFVTYRQNNEHPTTQLLCEESYLLNDSGKTIERLI